VAGEAGAGGGASDTGSSTSGTGAPGGARTRRGRVYIHVGGVPHTATGTWRAGKRPKGPPTRSPRPPCRGLATLAGSCGAPCGAPPALASEPGALRHRCDRRTALPPLRKGRPSLRRIRLPLRGARPPCGGTAVRSSRPLRADQMIARRGRDPQGGLSTRFGVLGRVIHGPSTDAIHGPCPEGGQSHGPRGAAVTSTRRGVLASCG